MSEVTASIKLTADTKEVERDIQRLSREIQGMGDTTTSSKPGKSSDSQKSPQSETSHSKESAQEDIDKRVRQAISRELTLIRKELQSQRSDKSSGGTSNGEGTKSPSSPKTPSKESPKEEPEQQSLLKELLKGAATMAVASKALSSAFSSLSNSSRSAQSGAALAYETYGSTLAVLDYSRQRKSASELGMQYGYNSDDVLNAAKSNMSTAGFTNMGLHNLDMDNIFRAAHGTGIDLGTLAQAAGSASAKGVGGIGNQKKFTDMLANSIVDANMKGREGEQLRVLENIADMLNSTMVTVKEQDVGNVLNLYSTLASGNENLRGQAGASLIENLNSGITNGTTATDILLGWGTTYTGLGGKNQLARRKEEGLSNPQNLASIFNNFERMYGQSTGSEAFRLYLSSEWGLSQTQIDELLSHQDEIKSGNYKFNSLDEGKADKYYGERQENYNNDKLSTQQRHDVQKKENSDNRGDKVNDVRSPLQDFYNGLPEWAQQGVDVTGWGVKNVALPAIGIKGAQMILPKVFPSLAKTFPKVFPKATATAGGISVGGLAASTAILAAAPLLASGGSYKHLTSAGRKSDANDWMDKYSYEMSRDNMSLDDKWEDVKYGNGVHYGNYTKEDLKNRAEARTEMMNFYNSEEGVRYFQENIQKRLDSGNSISDDFLSGLLSWTSDKGVTYTGSQGDIDELLKNMYGDKYKSKASGWYSGRWANSYVNSFLKKNSDSFDASSMTYNGLQYSGDSLVTENNTTAVEELTVELKEIQTWLSEHGVNGTGTQSEYAIRSKYREMLGFSGTLPSCSLGLNSHATGNPYVPFDNYMALLHKGEMVLTEHEASEYRQGKGTSGGSSTLDLNININGNVQGMNSENQERIVAAIVAQIQSANGGLQNRLSTSFVRMQNY